MAGRRVGIVGAEGLKFTPRMEQIARQVIRGILTSREDQYPKFEPGVYSQKSPFVVVSGGCHLGGVDVWAVEEARARGWEVVEHLPKARAWPYYKERNEKIAQDCDELHVIVVRGYHKRYNGMKFPSCYHCHTNTHVKSGGCWTGHFAKRLFHTPVVWHLIEVVDE